MEKDNKLKTYTDLALESAELLNANETDHSIDGIKLKIEEKSFNQNKIKISRVEITNKNGETKMGKPIGNYITVESKSMKENNIEIHEEIIKILSNELINLHTLEKNSTVLIVGLGNWNVTPDALGPKVISKVLVTNHMIDILPKDLKNHVRPVSAISPGVMGLTGIETGEIIKGIVNNIKPDLVIAIDALAARYTSRINTTIQISDTGISPGSGVGNKRMELNEETLGVKVIAIGVPTVVDAATLVNDSLDMLLSSMISQVEEGSSFYEMLSDLESEEKYNMIRNVLDPYAGNMFVTPKEVDSLIDILSNIIANTINIALHEGIDKSDINRYIY